MTDKSKAERDQRALDALIVSQLRRHEDSDEIDLEKLPQLTSEEKVGLESLGPDFIDRLVSGEVTPSKDEPDNVCNDDQLACAGGMSFGMNRADEVDEEIERRLQEKRNEVVDRLRNKKGTDDGQSDC